MQRMSEPQMVDAFMRRRTSPCPGTGTGTSRNSVVLLPGRKAPSIVSGMSCLLNDANRSVRRDFAVEIPQILPSPGGLPEEDLAFDQAAIAVDGGDGAHV